MGSLPNTFKSKIRILVACCLFATSSVFGQNLIKNGSFESSFTNWSNATAGMSNFAITNTVRNSGANACSINITGKPTNFWDISLGNGPLALILGQSYTLTFYAKSQTEGAIIDIVLQNKGYQSKTFILNSVWTKYTWIFNPSEVAPNFSVQLGFSQNVGKTLYIDDIQLTPPTSLASQPFSDSVVVKIANKHQVIQGIGGAFAYQDAALFQNYNENKPYVATMDSLFSGLRFSWIRFFNLWTDSTNFRKDYFKFDSALVGNAQRRLGFKPKIQITSWSAPAYLKQNNVVNGTNTTNPGIPTLKKNSNGTYKYNEFGQWWLRSVKKYQSFGIYPDYISIQNELDFDVPYECTRFDPVENATFAGYGPALNSVYNAIQTLSKKPIIIGPETYGVGGNQVQRYLIPLTNAWQLGGYAYHLYSGSMSNPDGYLPDLSALSTRLGDKPSFQTEFYNDYEDPVTKKHGLPDPKSVLHQAWMMHNTFVVGGASAYVHWDPLWGNSPSAFINFDGSNVRQHYFAFKQYSRFIHPGWYRVDGNSNSTYLRSSAYANAAGDSLTVVVINLGTQEGSVKFNLGDFVTNGGTIYQTNQSNFKCVKTGTYTKGSVFKIPGETVATLTFVKNISPLVSITSPGNNASFSVSSPVLIGIKATDADGTITNVKVFDGKTQIALLTGSSFKYSWNVTTLGIHTLTAIAMDNAGATTTSKPILVTIKCGLPSSLGSIIGNSTVCGIVSGNYSVPTVSGVTRYFWQVPAGISIISGQNTAKVSLNIGSIGGKIVVLPINSCGTGAGSNLSITVKQVIAPKVTISSSNVAVCAGTNVSLSALGTNGGSSPTYTWFRNGVQIGQGTALSLTPANGDQVYAKMSVGGNVLACLSATNAVSNTINLTVNPLPTITPNLKKDSEVYYQPNTSSATICAGDGIAFAPWPVTTSSWSWTGPNGFTSSIRNPKVSPMSTSQSGTYVVKFTDAKGCSASVAYTITVNPQVTWYADTDGDGKGDPNAAVQSCDQPAGYVAVAGDACPTDAFKTAPGNCGCGIAESVCAPVAAGTYLIKPLNNLSYSLAAGSTSLIQGTSDATAANQRWILVPTAVAGQYSIKNAGTKAYLTPNSLSFGSRLNAFSTSPNIWKLEFAGVTPDGIGTFRLLPANDLTKVVYNKTATAINLFLGAVADMPNQKFVFEYVSSTVSRESGEMESSSALQAGLYPNPFESQVRILASGSFTYTVTNLAGLEIEKGAGENQIITGQNWEHGMYFVRIQTGDISMIQKVVKE